MNKRGEINAKKLAVLASIEEKKSVLFGNFKNTCAKEKQSAWEEVLEKAKALELASADRSWTYARDNLFGLWKSRSIASKYFLFLIVGFNLLIQLENCFHSM